MALTNRGKVAATVSFTYTAAFGGGSGTASDILPAGQQRTVSDAIGYLRSLGIPIPASSNQGGTLRVSFSGISPSEGSVTVRTATAVANGRAGLAYNGIPVSSTLTESAYLCGLRQTATDRSNVAIQNVGTEGDIVLRVTVYSGDPANPFSQDVLLTTLGPGAFTQISGVLQSNGLSLTNGFVRVSKVSGSSPYFAYAVINDQSNSDGSFVPPLLESSLLNHTGQTLPVIVETSAFSSELVVTNLSASLTNTYHFSFVSSAISSANNTANFNITLKPREQAIIPNLVQYLRDHADWRDCTPGKFHLRGIVRDGRHKQSLLRCTDLDPRWRRPIRTVLCRRSLWIGQHDGCLDLRPAARWAESVKCGSGQYGRGEWEPRHFQH